MDHRDAGEAPLPGRKATHDRNAAQMIGREVGDLPAPTSKARGVFQLVSEVEVASASNSLPVRSPRAWARRTSRRRRVQRGFVAKMVISEDRNNEKVGAGPGRAASQRYRRRPVGCMHRVELFVGRVPGCPAAPGIACPAAVRA